MSTAFSLGQQVRCRNWSEYPSIRDVILRIREMDAYCFEPLASEDWGTPEGWLAIARKNPYMNVCLEIDGEIMGSIHWLWLNRPARDRYLAGKLRDGQIKPEDTVAAPPYHEPVYLYLLSMMVHPAFQGHGFLKKLWNHAIHEHEQWGKKGIFFAEAYATAWSDAGVAILSQAGGKEIGADLFGHRMLRIPTPLCKLALKSDMETSLSLQPILA